MDKQDKILIVFLAICVMISVAFKAQRWDGDLFDKTNSNVMEVQR